MHRIVTGHPLSRRHHPLSWGVKVKIAAPAAGKVTSEKKLDAKTRKAVMKAGYPESGPF